MHKRILLVGNFLSAKRGWHGVCEDLAVRLQAAGHVVITTSSSAHRVARVQEMLSTVWRRRHEYDVAHVDVFSGKAFLWAEAVCLSLRTLHKPYILTLRGGDLPQFSERHPSRVRRLLRPAAAVAAPSQYLSQALGHYRPDIRLLPNAVELDSYHFRLRTKCSPAMVWLRSFHRMYNPCLAPQALALIAKKYPSMQLTMIGPDRGDGSLEETRKAALQAGVSNNMRLAGPVSKSEIPTYLDAADIFLNTTDIDNTPVTVLEACASGLCVVSTNVGGIPFLLNHDRDAILVPPRDPDAIADAVDRLLTDEPLAQKLSRNARATSQQYDWRSLLAKWEELFDSTAA